MPILCEFHQGLLDHLGESRVNVYHLCHLVPVETVETLLAASGFAPLRWEDKSEASAVFFRERLRQAESPGQPIANLSLLMGEDAGPKFRNVLRSLEEGRLQVVQAVMKRLS